MPWNWELLGWPRFRYAISILEKERDFFLGIGGMGALLKNIKGAQRVQFIAQVLTPDCPLISLKAYFKVVDAYLRDEAKLESLASHGK